MTVLDVVILAVIAICAIYGARQGLIRELSHVVAFVLGIFLASRLHSTAARLFLYQMPSNSAAVAAFLGLLILVLAAVYLAFSYAKSAADKLKLGSADHVAGAVFGAVQGAVVCALIIFVLVNFSAALPSSYLERSRVASFMLDRSGSVSRLVPQSYISRVMSLFGKETLPAGDLLKKASEELDQDTATVQEPDREQSGPVPVLQQPISRIPVPGNN